jgi:pSer/pThr/pTyr-binding forkhead associated (FHA) protein
MKPQAKKNSASSDIKTVATSAEQMDRVGRRLSVASEIIRSLEKQIAEASLVLITNVERPLPRPIGTKTTVGRSATAGWPVDDAALSRLHFEVSQTDCGCLLRDLNSHNGTIVNGAQCRERWLVDGDMICAGRQAFLFLGNLEH